MEWRFMAFNTKSSVVLPKSDECWRHRALLLAREYFYNLLQTIL